MRYLNHKIPLGIFAFRFLCPVSPQKQILVNRILILGLTYLTYIAYHLSRKPISVVKTEFINCTISEDNCTSYITEMNGKSEMEAKGLEGILDGVYLFSYAFFMFFSGIVAERVNLRVFLTLGCLGSSLFTILFGAAKALNIHSIYYFIVIQFFGGLFQSTGWPGVVTAVANWFGKSKKGLIFGLWNSHTSVGNILGSLIAGAYVSSNWGLSFIVPGIIIGCAGLTLWFFLIPHPKDVDLEVNSSQSNVDLLRDSSGETTPLLQSDEESEERNDENVTEETAIGFFDALKIPGIIEFSLCFFFSKLVSYTFLYWLPSLISDGGAMSNEDAAYLSTLFDIGGILGGILAGLASDLTGKSATTCFLMLSAAIPTLFYYNTFRSSCELNYDINNSCYLSTVFLLLLIGLLVNGPYALITTAVSAELGRHPSLGNSAKALATVTSIIDGTGSLGAALGPSLVGLIGTKYVFYMLMFSDLFALLLLVRLVKGEISGWWIARREQRLSSLYS